MCVLVHRSSRVAAEARVSLAEVQSLIARGARRGRVTTAIGMSQRASGRRVQIGADVGPDSAAPTYGLICVRRYRRVHSADGRFSRRHIRVTHLVGSSGHSSSAVWFDLGVVEEVARVDYRLKRHGWSEADVVIGHQQAQLTASYLTDALGDLVRAGREIAAGREAARVTWAFEPGCYRWKFDRHGADLDVDIWRYEEDWGPDSEVDGSLVMHAECSALAMVRAVSVSAHTVLDAHGVDGYMKEWQHAAFPISDLAQLDSLIAHGTVERFT